MFPPDLPASPLKDDRQCGVYNSAHEGHWRSLSCESALPYICKKTPNDTRKAEPLGESVCARCAWPPDIQTVFLLRCPGLWWEWIMSRWTMHERLLLLMCLSYVASTAAGHLGGEPSDLSSLWPCWLQRPKQCEHLWIRVEIMCSDLCSYLDSSCSYRELEVYPDRVWSRLVAPQWLLLQGAAQNRSRQLGGVFPDLQLQGGEPYQPPLSVPSGNGA